MGYARHTFNELRDGARIEWDRNTSKFKNWAIGNTDTTGLDASAREMSKIIVQQFGTLSFREDGGMAKLMATMGGNFDTNADDLRTVADTAIEAIAKVDKKTGGHAASKASNLKQRAKNSDAGQWTSQNKAALKRKVEDAMRPVKRALEETWLSNNSDWLKFAVAEASQLLAFAGGQAVAIATEAIEKAAPGLGYASDGLQIGTGVWQSMQNSYYWYKFEKRRSDYAVLNGAPQLIIKALERHYATRVGGGAFKAALGSTSIVTRAVFDGGGFGTGGIIGLVVGVVTAIGHFLDGLLERLFLRFAFKQAKDASEAQDTIYNDYDKFCSWFQNWLVVSPVLSALALKISYTNEHKYDFIKHTGNSTDAQAYEESNVMYMDKLRTHATRYLNQHRDEYTIKFVSSDGEVGSVLTGAYAA